MLLQCGFLMDWEAYVSNVVKILQIFRMILIFLDRLTSYNILVVLLCRMVWCDIVWGILEKNLFLLESKKIGSLLQYLSSSNEWHDSGIVALCDDEEMRWDDVEKREWQSEIWKLKGRVLVERCEVMSFNESAVLLSALNTTKPSSVNCNQWASQPVSKSLWSESSHIIVPSNIIFLNWMRGMEWLNNMPSSLRKHYKNLLLSNYMIYCSFLIHFFVMRKNTLLPDRYNLKVWFFIPVAGPCDMV